MDALVWLNGELVPTAGAKVSVLDRGLLYGDGLFETMRAHAGRIFRLEQHINRLRQGADILGIHIPHTDEDLRTAVTEALVGNALSDASVRLAVTRGAGLGPVPGESELTVFIVAREFAPYDEELYQRGMTAITATETRNERSSLSQVKSANYLQSILARMEAARNGAHEAILLNTRGYVAEASTSNIFAVKNNTLTTPSLDSGVLPGITRAVVIDLAKQADLDVIERTMPPDDLLAADELFLTNSLMQIMPLTELDGQPIGSGRPGQVTRRMAEAYEELLRRETEGG